jgi:transposase
MTRAISVDLKERIVKWYHEDGMTMEQISSHASVSVGLVSKVISIHRQYGQVADPFRCRTGRPSYLRNGNATYLQAILNANPALFLDEIQERLLSVRNLDVSIATICRALRQLDLNRKCISKTAMQCDEELRTLWEAEMAEYTDPEAFVFLDESAVDQSTAHRSHGRSDIGTRCVRWMSFIRGIRHSILPALSLDGIIALDIFEGSVTKALFLSFLREQVVNFLALATAYAE